MISFRELSASFKPLNLERSIPIIVHSSLSAFGEIRGGADTLLGALLSNFDSIIVPTFTYKTMLIPEEGPENNGVLYGSGQDLNRMAEFFTAKMPADPLMGVLANTLLHHPRSVRSCHPILSFAGIGADEILQSQTIADPLAPIKKLAEQQGWVLLLGVNHTVNTSIHLGEAMAGRKQFTRWALTQKGVLECPHFPGCSEGFEQIAPSLEDFTCSIKIGEADVQAIPIKVLIAKVMQIINEDPLALLCNHPECERCTAIRDEIRKAELI